MKKCWQLNSLCEDVLSLDDIYPLSLSASPQTRQRAGHAAKDIRCSALGCNYQFRGTCWQVTAHIYSYETFCMLQTEQIRYGFFCCSLFLYFQRTNMNSRPWPDTVKRQISAFSAMLTDEENGEATSDVGRAPGLLGAVFEKEGMPPTGSDHPANRPRVMPHTCDHSQFVTYL